MKMGEFAKKHNVTVDTVRHYINIGLLTPLRENTQFNFSEIDDNVMESISLLKSMNYKLEEMKGFLLFQTMFSNSSFKQIDNVQKKFKDKLEENKREIRKLQEMNELIEKQLGETKKSEFKRGVPLSMLSELVCPDCGKQLSLDASDITNNEILEGKLVCPKCGKTYYIRFGLLSDKEIDEFDSDGIKSWFDGIFDQYIEKNDENYILKIREFYQRTAEIVSENSQSAKNIFIDGESSGFINSGIFRSLPRDANVFIRVSSVLIKTFMEDILPKNAIIYQGDMNNVPYKQSVDYMFLQDYDVFKYYNNELSIYNNISLNAKVDCFKVFVYDLANGFSNYEEFTKDMSTQGFSIEKEYRTGKIINKKDSVDISILKKDSDVEIEYGIYTLKR